MTSTGQSVIIKSCYKKVNQLVCEADPVMLMITKGIMSKEEELSLFMFNNMNTAQGGVALVFPVLAPDKAGHGNSLVLIQCGLLIARTLTQKS